MAVLPDSRMVHTIPARHCMPCHARHFDGKAAVDKGYLLEILQLLKER